MGKLLPPIIGLTGKARTGKDTAARFIAIETHGWMYSFADPIRAMIRAGLGVDMREKYWQDNKEKVIETIGRSPRELMQTLGTEWGRDRVNPDLWLILAAAQLLNRGSGMIVPDVRFENEAKWIRERGGVILHVHRRSAEEIVAHSSEDGVNMSPGETRIDNDGTLQDLQNQVTEIVSGWRT